MASTEIRTPPFQYTAFYYPEILEELIVDKRARLPELSDEDPHEPFIQLLRAFALAADLNNKLLDAVANERFLPTAKTRPAVAAHLALIGVQLRQAAPAAAELVFKLSRDFAAEAVVVPARSRFATEGTGGAAGVVFETLTDIVTARTDQLGWIRSYDAATETWTEHAGSAFTPGWGASPGPGDLLCFGHRDAMTDELGVEITVPASGITAGVWEVYDADLADAAPDAVTQESDHLVLDLTSWLGEADRSGTRVRVRSNVTGAFEDELEVAYEGGVNLVETATLLGQGTVSTDPSDYTVGAHWQELPGLSDGTERLSAAGAQTVSWTLPQTATRSWDRTSLGPGSGDLGYWIRFRVIAVDSLPETPAIAAIDFTAGARYLFGSASQGESREDYPLGASSGEPSQSFELANYPGVDDATFRLWCYEGAVCGEWTRVSDFSNSIATDRHFLVRFDDEGRATLRFGDGTNGRIPSAGSDNVRAAYRTIPADQNGNVGPGAISINRGGNSYVESVTNPRAASGYAPADGATPESLEQVKLSGPATLRTLSKGVTRDDIEHLTAAFTAADGSRPFGRALAIEEALGPKTVQAVVVGSSGGAATASYLTELEAYFNGSGDTRGVLVLNQRLSATNFTPRPIDIELTLHGGSRAAVETALGQLLTPLARKSDGVNFEWAFGGEVPTSRIVAAIMNTAPSPRKVDLVAPAANVTLAERELPALGTLTITYVP